MSRTVASAALLIGVAALTIGCGIQDERDPQGELRGIYAVVVSDLSAGLDSSFVVTWDTFDQTDWKDQRESTPKEFEAALEAWATAARHEPDIGQLEALGHPVLHPDSASRLAREAMAGGRPYPQNVTVTSVGFDNGVERAVVFGSYSRGVLDAKGILYFIQRRGMSWRIEEKWMLWIS